MEKKFPLSPITKKMLPVLLSAVFLLPLAAQAEIKAGSVEVSPFAGYNFFDKQHNLEDTSVFGGRIGYNFTNRIGVEGTGEFSKSRVDDVNQTFSEQGQFISPIKDVKMTSYHLDLVYHFRPASQFTPFIVAGYGASHFNPATNDKNMRLIDYGVGAKYWVSDNIALRADLRDKMTFDEHLHDLSATAGVVFSFGGADLIK
jgi:OOP family OmpA-OmpF porin